MSVSVRLSTPFREVTGGKGEVESGGADVSELFKNLDQTYPGFHDLIFEENGNFQEHAHIFINGEDCRPMGGTAAALSDGDVVSVLFAISGG